MWRAAAISSSNIHISGVMRPTGSVLDSNRCAWAPMAAWRPLAELRSLLQLSCLALALTSCLSSMQGACASTAPVPAGTVIIGCGGAAACNCCRRRCRRRQTGSLLLIDSADCKRMPPSFHFVCIRSYADKNSAASAGTSLQQMTQNPSAYKSSLDAIFTEWTVLNNRQYGAQQVAASLQVS